MSDVTPPPQTPRRVGDDAAAPSGPATWKVVAGTLAAVLVVAAVAGGGWWWTNRDDDAGKVAVGETAATEPATPDPTGSLVVGDEGASLLFTRTTASGIELRANIALWGGDGGFFAEGTAVLMPEAVPVPAPAPVDVTTTVIAPVSADVTDADSNGLADVCEPIGDLTAWAISDRDITQGGTAWTEGHIGGFWPTTMWGGPGSRLFGIVVQVDPDVTLVRLVGPDGTTDEMAPVRGAVVVAIEAPAAMMDDDGMWDETMLRGIAVTAERADGSSERVATRQFEQGHPAWSMTGVCQQPGGEMVDFEIVPASTMPEVTLPAAGEQPADPAAADQAIRDALAAVMDTTRSDEERAGAVDDPVGLSDAFERVDEFFGTLSTESQVEISELVFVAPDQAVFTFERTLDRSPMAFLQGRARLLDGVWKITRSTYCGELPPEICGV